jgi:DNA-binding PadR family transcriptional regulator
MKPDCTEYLPLSPATMHVLLALASGDLHGYGILLEVARGSQGAYKIGPGTLYDNLKKLLSQGLVKEAGSNTKQSPPRREYHLTKLGCDVLRAETERLAQVVREARLRLRPREGAQA